MPAWFEEHQSLLLAIAGASLFMFLATLVAVPWMLLRIPPGYFTHDHRPPGLWAGRSPPLRWTLRIAKNLFGGVCIVAGLAMLALPGQGLLTIFVGLLLIEFPGKYTLEKRVMRGRRLRAWLNRLRTHRGRPPLEPPPHNVG